MKEKNSMAKTNRFNEVRKQMEINFSILFPLFHPLPNQLSGGKDQRSSDLKSSGHFFSLLHPFKFHNPLCYFFFQLFSNNKVFYSFLLNFLFRNKTEYIESIGMDLLILSFSIHEHGISCHLFVSSLIFLLVYFIVLKCCYRWRHVCVLVFLE